MRPPWSPIISAQDLDRRYGEGETAVDALAGVTVDFERSRLTAIMGPSGSGKSTLMHLLAGLDRPTGGQVLVEGTDISSLDDKRLTELRRDEVRLHLPVLQPAPGPLGRGEHRAAAVDRGPQARPRSGSTS